MAAKPPAAEPASARKPLPARPRSSSAETSSGADVDWTVEQKLWDEASKRNTVAHYELYLSQYPEGRFASVARLNLDQLKAEQAAAPNTAATARARGEDCLGLANAHGRRGSRTRSSWTPGTPATEAQLNLDRDSLIDLQLRLSALGFNTGGFDGSLGPRSRAAIGAWQRQSGIVETTYLTPQQHMFLVSQTDPLMAQVRAQYERDKAAAQKRQQAQKTVRTNTKDNQDNQGYREDPADHSQEDPRRRPTTISRTSRAIPRGPGWTMATAPASAPSPPAPCWEPPSVSPSERTRALPG